MNILPRLRFGLGWRSKSLALAILLLLGGSGAARSAQAPTIRLAQKSMVDTHAAFEIVGLDSMALARLAKGRLKQEDWNALFTVSVKKSKHGPTAKRTSILGTYEVTKKVLRFQPRFPLVRGLAYEAVFEPKHWPGGLKTPQSRLVAEFTIPRPVKGRATVVTRVYPRANKLPENELKFYIEFSAAMSQGDVYRHIKLLDGAGKPIELPFLELREELWDSEGKRFTLLFDPGRIKKGLKPREELGPVLENGKTYTLVIDRRWQDAEGDALKEAYRKTFRAGPAANGVVDPKTWKIAAPASGTRHALAVKFPKPLDRALLQRSLWVVNAQGRKMQGQMSVSDEEKTWQFTPATAWTAGAYDLVADTVLEDLAGNNMIRPFEVDVFRPIQKKIETKTVKVRFEVK